MLVLFENGTPRTLARHLIDNYMVTEARARGWKELENGDLLREAEAAGFECERGDTRQLGRGGNSTSSKLRLAALVTWPGGRRSEAVRFKVLLWARVRRTASLLPGVVTPVRQVRFLVLGIGRRVAVRGLFLILLAKLSRRLGGDLNILEGFEADTANQNVLFQSFHGLPGEVAGNVPNQHFFRWMRLRVRRYNESPGLIYDHDHTIILSGTIN